MTKSGKWMELRKDTRAPKTTERGPAAGAKAMWWPQNPEWSLVQWLPREYGSNGKETTTMVQGTCLRETETSPQQRKRKCNPEELMIQATADELKAGQNTTRSPQIRSSSSGKDTNTPWNHKEKPSEGTGPWTGAEPCPRKGQPMEPRKMPRRTIAAETAGHWKQAGAHTRQNPRILPAERHALLIALSPDGEYM